MDMNIEYGKKGENYFNLIKKLEMHDIIGPISESAALLPYFLYYLNNI